jgi:hypothetical protein
MIPRRDRTSGKEKTKRFQPLHYKDPNIAILMVKPKTSVQIYI